jgi:uncharacterized membrane protein
MIRIARYSYVAVAWAFVAAIAIQVLLIGLGLFANSEFRTLHVNVGWILHVVPLVVLVAAAAAGAGRRGILLAAAMAVLIWLVPILAAVRSTAPLLGAFHPLGAMVAFSLTIVVARGATNLAGGTEGRATTVREWLLVALVVAVLLFLSFSGSPEPT